MNKSISTGRVNQTVVETLNTSEAVDTYSLSERMNPPSAERIILSCETIVFYKLFFSSIINNFYKIF